MKFLKNKLSRLAWFFEKKALIFADDYCTSRTNITGYNVFSFLNGCCIVIGFILLSRFTDIKEFKRRLNECRKKKI